LAKKSLLKGRNLFGEPSTVLFRRDKSKQVRYFHNDLDFFIRLSYTGNVYYINEFLSEWRISSLNLTSNQVFGNLKKSLIKWDKMLKRHSELNVIGLNRFDKLISKTSVVIIILLKKVFIKFNNIKVKRKAKITKNKDNKMDL